MFLYGGRTVNVGIGKLVTVLLLSHHWRCGNDCKSVLKLVGGITLRCYESHYHRFLSKDPSKRLPVRFLGGDKRGERYFLTRIIYGGGGRSPTIERSFNPSYVWLCCQGPETENGILEMYHCFVVANFHLHWPVMAFIKWISALINGRNYLSNSLYSFSWYIILSWLIRLNILTKRLSQKLSKIL